MVKTLALSDSNDLELNNLNNLVMLERDAAILQNCRTISKTLYKECVFFQKLGVPYFETIWSSQGFLAIFVSFLTNALLKVEGVKSADNLTINIEKDILFYNVEIKTNTADLVLNNTLVQS